MAKENNGLIAALQDRLAEAMADSNMRAVELGKITGIPKSMVSYYLSGKSKPKADRLYKIALALDVSEAWLLGYDVPKRRTPEQKKNDTIVGIISKLRADPEFLDVVSKLAGLPAGEYASIKQLISALDQK